MASISPVLLFLAFFVGCVTAPPEGMKRLSQLPGMPQARLQSLEKVVSTAVMGYGYICPTVTDTYMPDPEGVSMIVTCFDGKTSANYRYVESKDGEWYTVTPTDERPAFPSLEDLYQRSINGEGFKCSRVTDIVPIKGEEIFQATCIEGKYKVVTEKSGRYTVSPW
jgi:hypothetical protein